MKNIKPFVYGVQYYRAPTPTSEEWREDIKNIRKLELNTVKLFVQWRWHERKREKFYWDDLDELFDICESRGLYTHINIVLDAIPQWVYKKCNCYQVDLQGRVLLPGADGCRYIGGWEPCFDNPILRKEAERFVKRLVKRYIERKSLVAWDVWNEPRSRPVGNCTCEESKKRYREWLKDKFGTIESFNQYFHKAWGNWEEVQPPAIMGDYAEMYVWRLWAMDKIASQIKWIYDLVKFLDKKHPVFAHVGIGSLLQDILNDTSNDSLNAKGLDFYGSSLVVWRPEIWEIDWRTNKERYDRLLPWITVHEILPWIQMDWIRNISPYFWCCELYTNSRNWIDLSPNDIKFWTWTVISAGAKGILFWQYKPERYGNETMDCGLVELDGSFTERSKEVSKIGRIIREHQEFFRAAKPAPAKIALVYDHRSDLISRMEHGDWDLWERKISFLGDGSYSYKMALKGAYGMFWMNNHPIDWVSIQDIEKICDYQMVYLPYPLVMDKKTADVLINYVKKGGFLISESSIGIRRENTWINCKVPNHGLDELFGCLEKKRFPVRSFQSVSFPEGKLNIKPHGFGSYLKLKTADAIGFWENTEPAIALNKFGKGKAVLLGMYPSISYLKSLKKDITETTKHDILTFTRWLVERVSLEKNVEIAGAKGFVASRLLVRGKETMIFFFNYSNRDECIILNKPGLKEPSAVTGVLELVPTNEGKWKFKVPPKEVACVHGWTDF